jgi:hypothetical protein
MLSILQEKHVNLPVTVFWFSEDSSEYGNAELGFEVDAAVFLSQLSFLP